LGYAERKEQSPQGNVPNLRFPEFSGEWEKYRLKDIANEYGVFILSGTQLNGDWKEADTPDQNLLRGAKSIADSIDLGMHILPATQKDFENMETVLAANTFDKPNVKLSIYKNRRGRYKGVYL
jgi:hypothetical protein